MKKIGRLTLPDFKTHYKITIMKTTGFWCKTNKAMEQKRVRNRPTHI